jgi:hypothetical protein
LTTNDLITAVQALSKFRERPLYRNTRGEKTKSGKDFRRGQIPIQASFKGIRQDG